MHNYIERKKYPILSQRLFQTHEYHNKIQAIATVWYDNGFWHINCHEIHKKYMHLCENIVRSWYATIEQHHTTNI
jgi:hypothetical protein